MLTAEQVAYFKTFGFVIFRNVFTAHELDTIQTEFDHRAAVATSYEPFDGTKYHTMIMMGRTRPSLLLFWMNLDSPVRRSSCTVRPSHGSPRPVGSWAKRTGTITQAATRDVAFCSSSTPMVRSVPAPVRCG